MFPWLLWEQLESHSLNNKIPRCWRDSLFHYFQLDNRIHRIQRDIPQIDHDIIDLPVVLQEVYCPSIFAVSLYKES